MQCCHGIVEGIDAYHLRLLSSFFVRWGLVISCFRRSPTRQRRPLQLAASRLADPAQAAGRVCREAREHVSLQMFFDRQAVARGSGDNVSCMVIAFS